MNNYLQDDETFISRLHDEKQQLEERYLKLKSFIISEDFNKIDINQRGLLRIQYHAIETYLTVLSERLLLTSPLIKAKIAPEAELQFSTNGLNPLIPNHSTTTT